MKELYLRNEQRRCCLSTSPLRRNALALVDDLLELPDYNLSVTFVTPRRMAQLNWNHLGHKGPTDILTFDYTDSNTIHGELVICPWVAAENANNYRVSLQRELLRYIIHGVLHLLGHDDKEPTACRKMKREENRLLRRLPGDG